MNDVPRLSSTDPLNNVAMRHCGAPNITLINAHAERNRSADL
jgi:hypothetical protein